MRSIGFILVGLSITVFTKIIPSDKAAVIVGSIGGAGLFLLLLDELQ